VTSPADDPAADEPVREQPVREQPVREQSIVDVPERSRFELHLGDELVGLADYLPSAAGLVLPHVEVDSRFSGQGLATVLVDAMIDELDRRGTTVVPVCPFVVDWFRKNPDRSHMIAPRSPN
jgi:predicted GNAT family acetyltransferase